MTRRDWRPFEEAREFARGLGLKSWGEWIEYRKSGQRPPDIPSAPDVVYKGAGWIGWRDWLGYVPSVRPHRKWRIFVEAREFVRSLGLKGQGEWRAYCKSGEKPVDIPSNPDAVYTDEWISWGDWLGTRPGLPGRLINRSRPFEEARAYVHNLGLKNHEAWRAYVKSGQKPADIPSNPQSVYTDEWISWFDWLNKGRHSWRPFEEARAYAHSLGLKGQGEWSAWTKSGQRPPDIPAYPSETYRDSGWTSWGDWVGTDRVWEGYREYRPFEEAREFVRSLGLKSHKEWREYCRSGEKPDDIPASPWVVYARRKNTKRMEINNYSAVEKQEEGEWRGWADWLGVVNQWSRVTLLAFLEDLRPHLPHLEEKELYAIISQSGAMPGFRKAFDKEGIGNLIRDLKENAGRGIEEALGRTSDEELDDAALADEVVIDTLPAEGVPPEAVIQAAVPEPSTETEEASGLPELATAKGLRSVDDLAELHYGLDDETAEFLVSNRVAALWNAYINAPDPPARALVDEALAGEGGRYFEMIRSRFRGEREAVQEIPVPAGWAFRPPGVGYDEPPTDPNLMQKRTAFEVLTKKRVGNWSGVGAGKTLAGILASRVAGCRHTVVITNKATLAGWQQEIYRAFPDSVVRIGKEPILGAHPEEYTYTLINYERFQIHTRGKLVRELIGAGADFAILDEVQLVKQRDKNASIRREAVAGLLEALQSQNADFRVLGMSATPVINNLLEARKLLEVVMGHSFSDLDAQATTANALAVHRALMVYGFRYRPDYETEMEPERLLEVGGNHLLEDLRASAATGVLGLEQALLPTKLEAVREHVRPGTIIYTHYVDGMIGPIRRFIESLGYNVGLYTGEDKSGLEPFLAGRVDVLVGSKPVGTGLDGLQTVCDRIIEMSLPWTGAEQEQLGRVCKPYPE